MIINCYHESWFSTNLNHKLTLVWNLFLHKFCLFFPVIHDTSSRIEKEVTIKITKVLDESAYIAPIVSALVTMAVLIVTSYLVVGFKSYNDLVKKEPDVKEKNDEELGQGDMPESPAPESDQGKYLFQIEIRITFNM